MRAAVSPLPVDTAPRPTAPATTQDHCLQHQRPQTRLQKDCTQRGRCPSSDPVRPLPTTPTTAPHIVRLQTQTMSLYHPNLLPCIGLSHLLPHPLGRASTASATTAAPHHLRLLATRLSPPTHLPATLTEESRARPAVSATPTATAQPHLRTSPAKKCSTQPVLRPDALHPAAAGNVCSKMGATTISTRTTPSSLAAAVTVKPKPKPKKPATAAISAPRYRQTATRTTSSRRRRRLLLLLRQARQRAQSGPDALALKTRARAQRELTTAVESQGPREQRISDGPRLTKKPLVS